MLKDLRALDVGRIKWPPHNSLKAQGFLGKVHIKQQIYMGWTLVAFEFAVLTIFKNYF